MSFSLADIRTSVSLHLSDISNLVWSETMIDEAVRSALSDISIVSGITLFLSGLDESVETTIPAIDRQALVVGAVAFALSFRVSGRFEDAPPVEDLPASFSQWALVKMAIFEEYLNKIKLRYFQSSSDVPYSHWEIDDL